MQERVWLRSHPLLFWDNQFQVHINELDTAFEMDIKTP